VGRKPAKTEFDPQASIVYLSRAVSISADVLVRFVRTETPPLNRGRWLWEPIFEEVPEPCSGQCRTAFPSAPSWEGARNVDRRSRALSP